MAWGSLRTQWAQWRTPILAILGFGTLVMTVVLIAPAFGISDHYRLTADVPTVPNPTLYDGLVSNLGMVAWTAGTFVALFTAALLRDRPAFSGMRRFLTYGGLLTGALLLDDLFMGHDSLLPDYLNIPELAGLAVIGAAVLGFLWVFRAVLPATPWLFLALAVLGLGLMTAFDVVEKEVTIPAHHVWEEGSKFIGIMMWSAYFVATSAEELRRLLDPHQRAEKRSSTDQGVA